MKDGQTINMSARALDPGYEILWYSLEKVLGQGGFGITYLAHDRNLDCKVALKEYLPTNFAYRHENFSVKPLSGDHHENFKWGLRRFLNEAQTLAKFGHDNIVRVHSVFELNNTAYMVMEYEQGENLATVFRSYTTGIDQEFCEKVFFPVFDGLKQIHKFGFIHRDIKPANIYIRDEFTPVLIDFGSARQTSQQQSADMTTLITKGYTPLEQYSSDYGEQGPWTDIYSLAAAMFEGITGEKPQDALSRSACLLRSTPDPIEPLKTIDHPEFQQPFLNAVYAGLALQPEDRPQNLEDWQVIFDTAQTRELTAVTRDDLRESLDPAEITEVRKENRQNHAHTRRVDTGAKKIVQIIQSTKSRFSRKTLFTIILGCLAVTGFVGGTYNYILSSADNKNQTVTTTTLAELPVPARIVRTVLPKEQTLRQLDHMETLGAIYGEAYSVDRFDDVLQRKIVDTYSKLEKLARVWNASSHADVNDRIIAVSRQLPDLQGRRAAVRKLVEMSDQRSVMEDVVNLIKSNKIADPVGDSVLDKVTTLSESDFMKIVKTPVWQQMMSTIRSAALNKLENQEFDNVARIVEVALSIQPSDQQMLLLRDHLALRNK